jgi:hypothetical protein
MNKKQNTNVLPGMALLGAVFFVGAYASITSAQPSPEDPSAQDPSAEQSSAEEPTPNYVCKADEECVDIEFTAKGCPVKAIPPDFEVENTKHIVWQSVDADGNDITTVDYEIYFDPFKGQPHTSTGKGRVKRKIDETAPATPPAEGGIGYKYTVAGTTCPDPKTKYHDPRFSVRR